MTIHHDAKFLREMPKYSSHDPAKGIKLTIAHQEFSFFIAHRAGFPAKIPVFVTFS
jgi:hypothetical protein